ncbi:flavoprotein [Thermoplasmatales archaeon SW_10_69_26]|nr:MAG: flavoprotein [Thermoplasmatales archaeon SW_10_69_26]
MTERYEAVVVGAGPSGLATALELARQDVETLVLERGKFPGSKNATGGIIYGQTNTEHNLDDVVPDLHENAPLERPIDGYEFHCMANEKVQSFDLTDLHQHNHKWSYTVLRSRFDRWLGERAHEACREAGGGLLSDVRVNGPLVENGEIVGVETEELDPIRADMVVAADGATSEMVRQAGLRDWEEPEDWFQGVKVVLDVPEDLIEENFDLDDEGEAHLFAGNIFEGVRGGGFLYTNDDTLSIGTVFHLDSLAENGTEPHRLMDRLLEHPLVQDWVGPDAEEVEYSAKLIPDGKKMLVDQPYRGRMVAVGDAAGQLQAQGPIIKGMNLGISAGILAGRSFAEAKAKNAPETVGERYHEALQDSYIPTSVRPSSYEIAASTSENEFVNGLLESFARSWLGRKLIGSGVGQARLESMMNSPSLMASAPDIRFSYVTLPEVIAEEAGEPVHGPPEGVVFEPRSLDDRIGDLTYDVDAGNPHIELLDDRPEISATAVHTCPVSDREISRGCYRFETRKANGGKERFVALDTQPCVECGTCAIVADTDWDHPRGGKGVEYEYG